MEKVFTEAKNDVCVFWEVNSNAPAAVLLIGWYQGLISSMMIFDQQGILFKNHKLQITFQFQKEPSYFFLVSYLQKLSLVHSLY
jgi:hypothetical protein